jgi:hypothetical protein
MSLIKQSSYFITIIVSLILAAMSISLYFYYFVALHTQITETIVLSIINGVATTALVLVAILNMQENRKVRSEMVRPHLSLEPTFFEYDKNGQIVGFNCLNLVNGGTVARDVEIDLLMKGKTNLLYASSIGASEKIQIWNGQSEEIGGSIVANIKYKNMFNKSLQEVLSLDMDSINSSKRKFAASTKD